MGKWIFLIFLVWAVWQDLRSRTVGQGFLAAAGSLGAAVSLLSGRSVLGAAVISSGRDLSSDTGTDHGWRDRGGRRMVFYCDRFFSGANRKFYAFFIGAHFLQCVQPCIYGRILHRRCRRPAEKASVPPLSASSGTLAGAFLKKERRLAASFTVEAALVLGLVFMVMGMTIKGGLYDP